MFGHIEMEDLPSLVRQHDQHEEHPEADRRDGEEVKRDDLRQVVLQENLPGGRGRSVHARAIPLDRGFRHRNHLLPNGAFLFGYGAPIPLLCDLHQLRSGFWCNIWCHQKCHLTISLDHTPATFALSRNRRNSFSRRRLARVVPLYHSPASSDSDRLKILVSAVQFCPCPPLLQGLARRLSPRFPFLCP